MDNDFFIRRERTGDLAVRIAGLSPEKRALLEFKLKKKGSDASGQETIPRSASRATAPLSFAQQRLWFLAQLEPDSAAYNIHRAIRLSGALNIEALQKSLDAIVARHEVLRTTFAGVDGVPVQVIAASRLVEFEVIDLSQRASSDQNREVQSLLDERIQRPFDLSSDLMLKATLVKLEREEHILLLVMHHIASDGWSLGILSRELSALYEAFSTAKPCPLSELPIQYADFAIWQRQWLQGKVLTGTLSYWKKFLEGAPSLLELPTDRPRPIFQTFRGDRKSLVLSKSLTEAIKKLSRQEGTTLFMTLLGAFQTLLYRHTAQDDIVVGTPIAGRNRAEIEALIGFFVNTLVLRTDLSGKPSFRELLVRVRRMALDAYAHQDLPFEKLVEELRPERDTGHTPMFQVFFNTLNFEGEQLRLSGLRAEPLLASAADSKFDLTLYVREQFQEIHLRLVYNVDLFCPDRMVELLEQYEQLLLQIVQNPDERIACFTLVTPASKKILPDPTQSLRSEWAGSVHGRLSQQAHRTPEKVAVLYKEAAWTYGELNSRCNQLAHYLLDNGIQANDLVAIYGHRSAALVWALLGVLKAGAAFVILDPAYPPSRLMECLRVAKPRAWIRIEAAGSVSDDLKEFLQACSCCCQLELPSPLMPVQTLMNYPIDDPEVSVGPDNLAYVAFTSGSTGEPKGILGTHRPLSHFLQWHSQTFGLNESDRFSFLSGLSHDPALRDIFTPLWLGATLCVPDPEEFGSPGYLTHWMKREEITIAHLTPAMVQLMTEIGIEAPVNGGNKFFPSSLRYAFFGGDILTKRDVSRFQDLFPSATCTSFYGATETPQAMGYFIIPKQKDNFHDDAIAKETIPLGRGIEGVQLLVLNDARQLTGTGELGEIYVRTPYLARGYLGDNALTQQRFITNPFTGIPGDRLYKTGDKGRYLSDGSLDFVGRADHQVKIRGFRIELGEVEAVISQHPAVRQTVVVAREDPTEEHFATENPKPKTRTELSRSIDPSRASGLKSEKRLVAYVVLDQEPPSTSSDLRRFLHEKLPDYMVPSVFVFLDALPLTPNGKVDRGALPAPDQGKPELKQNFVAPRTPVEERLAVIWAQVLGIKQVGVKDNFFDLGGHSLLAVRLFAEIEKAFKKRLLLSSLFQGATIEHLADLINQRTPLPSQSSLVAIQPKGSKRPFFCVHEFFGDVLCYMNLARCLGPDRPFYALQPRGLDGTEEPLADIATMAAHYIEEMRSVQPEGPYALGGLCFGGIVAFEMAQQLRAKGEAVALVALLDSGINRKQGRVAWWWSFLRNLPRDFPSWLIGSFQLNRVQWVNLIKLKTRMAKARLAVTFRSADVGRSLGYSTKLIEEMGDLSEFSEQHRKVARAQSRALGNYRPRVYPGRLTLFRARMQPFFSLHAPDKGWGRLAAGGLDIRIVPGNHLGMLQEPHVRVLAEQLKACLDRAQTGLMADRSLST